ncbi:hypothetical protein FNF27_04741 [Cafeteria roenbergensis]|uniref:Alpha/beta hydrolase n=1 Tax=Cafeteria roenbergensis TaxID=33653 RepID=A0A5A8E7L4_CAFRO|nr:hypothetical protein FNF27_04741 [Cafeteria roenbergensis]
MSARRAAEAAKRLVSHRVVQASGSVQQAKPIAFLPCALTNGSMFLGLAADLSARGFQSCIVQDCEPAGLDELLLGIHGCLMDTLYVPPVIVAQGTGCSLAQKYIETYGARAMVLVAPSAPDLGPSLRRLAPESEGLSGAAFDRAVADALRPGSAEEFARRWLLSPPGAEAPDALAVAAHVTRSGGINTRLLEELRAQPVELEPSPIPMMLVGSAGDALFPPDSDLRLLAEYHELEPEDVHIVGATGFGGQSGHVPGHALLVEEALDSEHSSVLSAITQFILR